MRTNIGAIIVPQNYTQLKDRRKKIKDFRAVTDEAPARARNADVTSTSYLLHNAISICDINQCK